MIVDSHTHIFEAGRGGPLDLPASADDLVRELDCNQVDRALVLPLPGIASNEFVARECAKHRDRLVGLYRPEFEHGREVITRMESFFGRYPVNGLKIHPRLQGVTVTQPIVREVLAWSAQRQVTIIFDAFLWGSSLGNVDMEPLAYHPVAQAFPELRMVLAHAGGHKIMDAFLVAKSNPNVFLDVSLTPVYFIGSSVAPDVGFICSRLPAGRLLYGSDFPYTYFRQHLEAVRELTAGIDDDARRMLFGDAARNLFHIA